MLELIHFPSQDEIIETYIYDLIDGDKNVGVVKIIFKNHTFKKVVYPFKCPYLREQWRILWLIEEEIKKIEESYANH